MVQSDIRFLRGLAAKTAQRQAEQQQALEALLRFIDACWPAIPCIEHGRDLPCYVCGRESDRDRGVVWIGYS